MIRAYKKSASCLQQSRCHVSPIFSTLLISLKSFYPAFPVLKQMPKGAFPASSHSMAMHIVCQCNQPCQCRSPCQCSCWIAPLLKGGSWHNLATGEAQKGCRVGWDRVGWNGVAGCQMPYLFPLSETHIMAKKHYARNRGAQSHRWLCGRLNMKVSLKPLIPFDWSLHHNGALDLVVIATVAVYYQAWCPHKIGL